MRYRLALLCCVWSAAALAAPEKVAVLPVEAPDADLALRIQGALRAGVGLNPKLVDAGPVVMTVEEIRLAFGCYGDEPECMSRAGQVLQVTQLLWARLAQREGTWVFELHLLDTASGRAARNLRITELGPDQRAELERLAQAFAAGEAPEVAAARRVVLRVVATPPGAMVRLDGRKLGPAPARVEVSPGVYAVGVSQAGYVTDERMVRVGQAPVEVSVVLRADSVAAATAATPPEPTGLSRRQWGAIGLGALALAAGTVAVVAGVETLNLRDEAARSPKEGAAYREAQDDFDRARLVTNLSAGIAGVAGAAALGLYLWDRFDPAVAGARLQPTLGGLTLQGRF